MEIRKVFHKFTASPYRPKHGNIQNHPRVTLELRVMRDPNSEKIGKQLKLGSRTLYFFKIMKDECDPYASCFLFF